MTTATTLHTYSDGGARGNPGPAAIGVVLCDAKDHILLEASHLIGETTNNRAEYLALLFALELSKTRKAKNLICHADSELLVYQLQGVYKIKDPHLKALSDKVKTLAQGFESVVYKQIPRESLMIARADKLLNETLNRAKLKGRSKNTMLSGDSGGQQEMF